MFEIEKNKTAEIAAAVFSRILRFFNVYLKKIIMCMIVKKLR